MSILDGWSMDPPPTLRERVMLRFMSAVTETRGWEKRVLMRGRSWHSASIEVI